MKLLHITSEKRLFPNTIKTHACNNNIIDGYIYNIIIVAISIIAAVNDVIPMM